MNTNEELVSKLLLISKLYSELKSEEAPDVYYLPKVKYPCTFILLSPKKEVVECKMDSSETFVLLPLKEESIDSKQAKDLGEEIDNLFFLDEETLKRCIHLALEESWNLRTRMLPEDGSPATEERKAEANYKKDCIAAHLLRRMGTSENTTQLKRALHCIHPGVPHIHKDLENVFYHSPEELKNLLKTMLDITRKTREGMDYQLPYKKEYIEFVDQWCAKYPQLWQHAKAYWRYRDTPIPRVRSVDQIVFDVRLYLGSKYD